MFRCGELLWLLWSAKPGVTSTKKTAMVLCVVRCRELLRLLRSAEPGVTDAALRFISVQLYLVLMEGDGSLSFVDLVKARGFGGRR